MRKLKNKLITVIVISLCILIVSISFYGSGFYTHSFSLGRIIYLIIGLTVVSVMGLIVKYVWDYKSGKFFCGYLCLMFIQLCIISAGYKGDNYIHIATGIIFIVSNIWLYLSISLLMKFERNRYYKMFTLCLIVLSVIFICLYITLLKIGTIILIIHCWIVVFFIVKNSFTGYAEMSSVNQHRVKVLVGGFLSGLVIFLFAETMPFISIIESGSYASDKEGVVYYEDIPVEINDYDMLNEPLLIFNGIVVAVIYLYIKQQYIWPIGKRTIVRNVLILIYFLVIEIFIRYGLQLSLNCFLVLNILLWFPWGMSNVQNMIYPLEGGEVLEKVEEERKRIARYMHDDIIQNLIAISYKIEDVQSKTILKNTIKDIRGLGSDLYPTIVEDMGILHALEELIIGFEKVYGINIYLNCECKNIGLDNRGTLILYRSIKELINNACKHSKCDQICVNIKSGRNGTTAEVCDNGIGFSLEEYRKKTKNNHMGLASIQSDLNLYGGIIKVSREKENTLVMIIMNNKTI